MSGMRIARRGFLAGAALLPMAGGALAQVTARPATAATEDLLRPPIELLDSWVDAYGRPTAKVTINGKGPFDFLVDTGSNTTVLAARIALEVGAVATGVATVHGTTGDAEMPVAQVHELSTGVAVQRNLRVAVINDSYLSAQAGILGADVFASKRLTFDIAGKQVSVSAPDRRARAPLQAPLRIRNRMLAEIDGRVGRYAGRLMLDTGAQNCLINPAFARLVRRGYPKLRVVERVVISGVTGHRMTGDYLELPDVKLGDMSIRDAGAVIVDAPVFRVWGLENEPVLIVGVNVLSRLASFSIDYGARRFDAIPMAGRTDFPAVLTS
jgi:predicted aspartyl protease